MSNLTLTMEAPATKHEALLQHPTEDRLMTPAEMQLVRLTLLNLAVGFFHDYKTRAYEGVKQAADVYETALRSK